MVAPLKTKNVYETVIKSTSKIEQQIKRMFGSEAKGHGLGSLIGSVNQQLPRNLRKRIRDLSRTRNDVVHNGRTLTHDELGRYEAKARNILEALQELPKQSEYLNRKDVCEDWLQTCPFTLDNQAKSEILGALRRQVDERPWGTNSHTASNGLFDKAALDSGKVIHNQIIKPSRRD